MAKKKVEGKVLEVTATAPGHVVVSSIGAIERDEHGNVTFQMKKPRSSKVLTRVVLKSKIIRIDQNGDDFDITMLGMADVGGADGTHEVTEDGYIQITNAEGEVTLFNEENVDLNLEGEADDEAPAAKGKGKAKAAPAKGKGKAKAAVEDEEEEEEEEEAEEEEEEEDEKPAKGKAKAKPAAKGKGKANKGGKWR